MNDDDDENAIITGSNTDIPMKALRIIIIIMI